MCILLSLPVIIYGQSERKLIREGYKAYMEEDFSEAEINFRKAEEAGKEDFVARYNTSAAVYQQQKLEEAGSLFNELLAESDEPAERAKLLHNLGNVFTQSQQYSQAVEAYKQSLRINPGDDDTRYNLAYALEKLREQQQQQQQQDNSQQDQNQDQDQEQKDQDQQQQQQQEEEQDSEDKEQQQQQQQQNQDQEEQQEQPQPQKQELSKEEAERLLNAILQKEKDVKEKVDKKKATAAKIKTDKDW